MTIPSKSEVQSIADIAAKPFIEQIGDTPVIVYPAGEGEWRHQSLESLQLNPARRNGTISVHDIDSFITLTNIHASDSSVIYIDVDYGANRVKATAVVNDHRRDVAGWRDHRISMTPRFSEEWKRWTGSNGKSMSQIELANFLESNSANIIQIGGTPTAAEVLTFVTQLTEVRKVKYGNAVNLQNGMVQINFVEEGDDATKGKIEVFREFGLGLRPLFGGEGFQLRAFLRYRIDRNTGEIKFWFELQRPDLVLEKATEGVIERIRTEIDAATVVFGSPD